jgi:hypothetical protein
MRSMHLKSEIAQLTLSDRYASHAERRGWDSNPRWPQGPQRFSRPSHSAALAPLRTLGIIADAVVSFSIWLIEKFILQLAD